MPSVLFHPPPRALHRPIHNQRSEPGLPSLPSFLPRPSPHHHALHRHLQSYHPISARRPTAYRSHLSPPPTLLLLAVREDYLLKFRPALFTCCVRNRNPAVRLLVTMKVPLAVAVLLAATLPFILDSIGSMIIVGIIIACVWRQKSEDMMLELAAHTKGLTKEKYKLTDKVDELKVKVDELNGKVKRRQKELKELRVEVDKKNTLKGQVRKLKGQVADQVKELKELKVEKERREKAEAKLKKLKAAKPAIVHPPRVGGTADAKLKRAEAKILKVEGLRLASHIRHIEQIQRIDQMVVRPWHYARIFGHSKDPSSGRHFVANLDTGNQSDTIISKALYDALGGASAFPPTGRQVKLVGVGGHVVQRDVVLLRYELDGVAHGELLVDATVSTAAAVDPSFSWDLLISVKDIAKLQDYKMVAGKRDVVGWAHYTKSDLLSSLPTSWS